jgi:hypothetical protein
VDKAKILIVGSSKIPALELIFQNIFSKLGYNTHIFGAKDVFLRFYEYSFFNKISFRLGISNIYSRIQKDLLTTCRLSTPDWLFVFKGMEIFPSTLKEIKSFGVKLINFNPDHPFVFSGRGSGNSNVTESIRLFDLYFSYADDAVDSLKAFGVRSEKIPFGFDAFGFDYQPLKRVDEISRVCFLGNADKYRVQILNDLSKRGLPIDVYGENWSDFRLHADIHHFGPKYGNDFWFTLQSYAVQLNLLRPHNLNSHNMRSFDIPGSGGIMLAPMTRDHSLFFTNGKEVFLFHSIENAFSIAKYILSLSFEERSIIRNAARICSIEKHQYEARIKKIIQYLED